MRHENEAADLARFLGTFLRPGDTVALQGPMGGGKTTLVRYLSRELGSETDAVSPTFALQRVMTLNPRISGGATQLVHYDLYRIDDPRELQGLGFGMEDEDAIVVVEWPDRCPGLWERSLVRLEITLSDLGERWVRVWGPKSRLPGRQPDANGGSQE